jgi:hypothetical protein
MAGKGERRKGSMGEGRLSSSRLAWVLVLLPLALSLCLPFSHEARAQDDVVELLIRQRSEVRAAELLREVGGQVAPRGPARLGENTLYRLLHDRVLARRRVVADSTAEAARLAREDSLARLPATLPTIRWEKVEPDDQEPFLNAYRETFWYAAPRQAALDSIATPRWRALLNGLFGAPTRNAAAAEQEGYAGSEYVQFEYWFVVNDSIPVLVLDRDGPFGHGLLVARPPSPITTTPTTGSSGTRSATTEPNTPCGRSAALAGRPAASATSAGAFSGSAPS